jgi:hypothetical protein
MASLVESTSDGRPEPVVSHFSIAPDSRGVSLVEGEHATEPFASADAADGRIATGALLEVLPRPQRTCPQQVPRPLNAKLPWGVVRMVIEAA